MNIWRIDWQGRRLINKLYIDQSVKVRLDQGRQKVWRLVEVSERDAVCQRFYSTCRANTWKLKL